MSGNPFYVPPVIPDMSQNILRIGEMKMHSDNLAADRAMRQQQFTEESAYRNKMLENDTAKIGLDQKRMDIEERKLPPSQQNFSHSDILPFMASMKQRGYDKVFQPVFDTVLGWAKDSKVTKGVAASNVKGQWDTFLKPKAIEGLQKEYMKLAEDPNFKGSQKEKEILSMIDGFSQMSGDDAKGMFFPSVIQEEANTKAALEEMKAKNKHLVIPEGGVLMEDGKPVFKNPRTYKPEEAARTEAASQKKISAAVRRIDEHIRVNYTEPNQQYQAKLDKYKLEPEEQKRLLDAIKYNNDQAARARNTANQLLNGEIAPEEIRWGGNGQANNDPLGIRK